LSRSLTVVLQNIETTINDLDKVYPLTEDISNYVKVANEMQSDSQSIKTEVRDYELIRKDTVLGAYSFILLGIVCGLFTGLLSSRVLAVITGIIFVLALPLALMLVGVNLPATTFVGDMCPQVDSYIKNETIKSSTDASWVDFYLNCEGPAPLKNWTDYIETQTYEVRVLLFWAQENNQTNKIAEYKEILGDLISISGNVSLIYNCSVVADTWNFAKDKICIGILDGLALIVITCLICACIFPCAIHHAFVIFKRERRSPHGDYMPLDEYQERGREKYTFTTIQN